MEHVRTISLRHFRANDRAVFSSLLTVLAFRTCDHWELVEQLDSDVVVVDVDTAAGAHLATELEQLGHCVIRFSTPDQNSHVQSRWLFKPLRAADILRCLIELKEMALCDDSIVSDWVTIPIAVSTAYRLKRWPDKNSLAPYPSFSRLCAVFLKQPITLERAAEMVNLPLADVEAFVFACYEQQLMTEHTVTATVLSDQHSPSVSEHAGLFKKLRSKLASRIQPCRN